jgi:hypothetical protein
MAEFAQAARRWRWPRAAAVATGAPATVNTMGPETLADLDPRPCQAPPQPPTPEHGPMPQLTRGLLGLAAVCPGCAAHDAAADAARQHGTVVAVPTWRWPGGGGPACACPRPGWAMAWPCHLAGGADPGRQRGSPGLGPGGTGPDLAGPDGVHAVRGGGWRAGAALATLAVLVIRPWRWGAPTTPLPGWPGRCCGWAPT